MPCLQSTNECLEKLLHNAMTERIVACHTHTTLLLVVISPSIVYVELLSSHLPYAILKLGKTLSCHLSLLKVHPAQACS